MRVLDDFPRSSRGCHLMASPGTSWHYATEPRFLNSGVKAAGYAEPTPIQLRAIPLVMEGRDVIGGAQTGTGKTAAFALPILSKLGSHGKAIRALILEPTRELAAQVETAVRDYARFSDLKVAVVYGGVGYGKKGTG